MPLFALASAPDAIFIKKQLRLVRHRLEKDGNVATLNKCKIRSMKRKKSESSSLERTFHKLFEFDNYASYQETLQVQARLKSRPPVAFTAPVAHSIARA
jgi:hypothetical protein